jgi:hypothetical protein
MRNPSARLTDSPRCRQIAFLQKVFGRIAWTNRRRDIWRKILNMRRQFRNLCLCITFAIVLPLAASADIVSGRVLGADQKPILNGTFTAKDAKGESTTFKSDPKGNFTVYLDPGKFTVSSSADPSLSGTIESFPQPRQQDVHLIKK